MWRWVVGCAQHPYCWWRQSGKLPPLAAASGAVRSFRLPSSVRKKRWAEPTLPLPPEPTVSRIERPVPFASFPRFREGRLCLSWCNEEGVRRSKRVSVAWDRNDE